MIPLRLVQTFNGSTRCRRHIELHRLILRRSLTANVDVLRLAAFTAWERKVTLPFLYMSIISKMESVLKKPTIVKETL